MDLELKSEKPHSPYLFKMENKKEFQFEKMNELLKRLVNLEFRDDEGMLGLQKEAKLLIREIDKL